MNTRRRPQIPAELRALALAARSPVVISGDVLPASPPGPLPPRADTAPRLPASPAPAYDPPTPPLLGGEPTPPLNYGNDLEAQLVQVPFPAAQNTVPGTLRTFSKEVSVYVTNTRWRGVDVFIDPSQLSTLIIPTTGVLVVRVYGYSAGGVATLLGQGMLGLTNTGHLSIDGRGTWVAAVRAIASRFQITVQYFDTAGPTFPTGLLNVTVQAADEAVPVPWDIGCVNASAIGPVDFIDLGNANPGANIDVPRVELVYVQGINGSGAPAYMQAFNGSHVAFPVGKVPDFVWPLGAVSGEGFAGRFSYVFGSGFTLAASSTPNTFTGIATAYVQALIR